MAENKQNMAAPTVQGAVGGRIPYEVLAQGLYVEATYSGFVLGEPLHMFIDSGDPLPLRESMMVTQAHVDLGLLGHGFKAADVAFLAGKEIEIYYTLPGRQPMPVSLRGRYSVDSAPSVSSLAGGNLTSRLPTATDDP